ncbi:MAG: HAMP domain-containing histidine kinase [Ruminococcus sp.]|nr:HAMP domain-containing histidine kinase [Ruminococcus sp.]
MYRFMFRKLSVKFSVIAIVLLFVLELLSVCLINGLNFYFTTQMIDETITLIAENNGTYPDKELSDEKDDRHSLPDSDSVDDEKPDDKNLEAEKKYVTRYFTAIFNENGDLLRINTAHIASVESSEAKEYALDVFDSGNDSGFYDSYNFRYSVIKSDNGRTLIIFCDFSSQFSSILRTIEISSVILLVLFAICAFLICVFSKRAVRPVMQNIQNQQRFITDAGHELKTPLAIIRADTEVISLTAGESEWTQSILNQTDRLSDLLSQFLMLAKSQEAQRFNFTKADVTSITEAAYETFSTYCNAQSKTLTADIAQGVYCSGDVNMLEVLISTLLENAVKYSSPESEIKLGLESGSRSLKLWTENLCEDPPTGDLRLLFERFYRGDSSRTRETGGSGIGLSLAKNIVDAHKGKIYCTVEDKRVTFTVKLPLGGNNASVSD